MLEVVIFEPAHLPAAARLLSARLRRLRRRVPALPNRLTRTREAAALLAGLLDPARTFVALDGPTVVGYLAWVEYADFRWSGRRGAYSPEYGNVVMAGRSAETWRALYGAASGRWFEARCEVHALTCLAGDAALERALVWSGFGMLLHDALRPMTELTVRPARGMRVRRATVDDVPALAELEIEHRRHYAMPPVLMIATPPDSAADLVAHIEAEPNAIWLVEVDGRPQGFMRFEPESHGAAVVSLAPTTISITGAYVRPAWRGHGAGRIMLAHAVEHYRRLGFERMAVDYETINPDALAFWPSYFSLVATSFMRVPERT